MVDLDFTTEANQQIEKLSPRERNKIIAELEEAELSEENNSLFKKNGNCWCLLLEDWLIYFNKKGCDEYQLLDIKIIDDPNDLSDGEREALLTEYSELREEIRLNQQLQHQRIVGGLTAIGAVIGYSLVANRLLFISLVPLLISILYVVTARMSNATLYLGRHVYDIENALDIRTEKFGWESRYGGVIRNNERFSMWDNSIVDWVVVPQFLLHVSIVLTYILLVGISLSILSSSELASELAVSPIIMAGTAYLILAIFAGISAFSFLKISSNLQP